MFQQKNLPDSLISVVAKWVDQNREFYIGPENLFEYRGHQIKYLINPDIPLEKGTWYAASENYDIGKIPALTRIQVEDIAMQLANYFYPTRWTIGLDYRCNYSCPMCPFHGKGYEDETARDFWLRRKAQQRIVPKEEAFQLIDILAENHITQLNLNSLGEIFLYPYWAEVGEYAFHKGMTLGLMTNGAMVDEALCRRMKKAGIRNVRVSLDALSYEVYSKVRSINKQYFAAAQNAPLLLKKHGFEVNVHFVIQPENTREANEFLTYWKTTDIDSISIAKQLTFHDGNSTTAADFEKDEFIHGMCSKYGIFFSMTSGVISACCEITGLFKDDDSHGLPQINILKDSFKDCAGALIDLMTGRNSSLQLICRNCPLYTLIFIEEVIGDWRVRRTGERETWFRQSRSN